MTPLGWMLIGILSWIYKLKCCMGWHNWIDEVEPSTRRLIKQCRFCYHRKRKDFDGRWHTLQK